MLHYSLKSHFFALFRSLLVRLDITTPSPSPLSDLFCVKPCKCVDTVILACLLFGNGFLCIERSAFCSCFIFSNLHYVFIAIQSPLINWVFKKIYIYWLFLSKLLFWPNYFVSYLAIVITFWITFGFHLSDLNQSALNELIFCMFLLTNLQCLDE